MCQALLVVDLDQKILEEPNVLLRVGCHCCRQTTSAQTVLSSRGSNRPSQDGAQSPKLDSQKWRPTQLALDERQAVFKTHSAFLQVS